MKNWRYANQREKDAAGLLISVAGVSRAWCYPCRYIRAQIEGGFLIAFREVGGYGWRVSVLSAAELWGPPVERVEVVSNYD